jgi:hypothetical protein
LKHINRSKAQNISSYRAPAEMAKTYSDIKNNFSGLTTSRGTKSKFVTETNSIEDMVSPNTSSCQISPDTEADQYDYRIASQLPKNLSKKLKKSL